MSDDEASYRYSDDGGSDVDYAYGSEDDDQVRRWLLHMCGALRRLRGGRERPIVVCPLLPYINPSDVHTHTQFRYYVAPLPGLHHKDAQGPGRTPPTPPVPARQGVLQTGDRRTPARVMIGADVSGR